MSARRVLRPSLGYVALAVGATAIVVTGAVTTRGEAGWTHLAYLAFSGLGLLAVVDTLTRRVVLAEDELRLDSLWSRRRYPRARIRRVTWEKGTGAAVQLDDDSWVRLPELGRNAQGVANTVRAWLGKGGAGA